MIALAQICNEKEHTVNVGLETNERAVAFYKSIGMTEMDVEKCDWNGQWYVAGHVPAKPEPSKEEQIVALKAELNELDAKSARSTRAILAGTATDEDKEFLKELEAKAEDLRQQIKDFEG